MRIRVSDDWLVHTIKDKTRMRKPAEESDRLQFRMKVDSKDGRGLGKLCIGKHQTYGEGVGLRPARKKENRLEEQKKDKGVQRCRKFWNERDDPR